MNPSDTVEVCEQNLSSFVQNKREVFDAMRAYQASELAHKTDAINFLKTILTVTVVLYGAILGALFSSEIVIEGKNWITFAILLGDCIAIFIVANATKKK
ncbi:MAG: hypothetical protein AB2556_11905 [Candidatus Thiodiazotropha sp.]